MQEEAGHDDQNPVQVDDASKLDYAQGQEKEEGDSGKEKAPTEAPQKKEGEQEGGPPEGEEEEEEQAVGEEDEDLGDYQDRPEDRGHVRPEAPDEELELPDELNLDGGEEEEENGDQGDEGEGDDGKEELDIREDGGAFPEQPEGAEDDNLEERKEPGEEGAEQEEHGEDERKEEEDGAQPVGGPAAQAEEGALDEEEEEEKDEGGDDQMIPADEETQETAEEAQTDADKGAAATVAPTSGTDLGAADQTEDMQIENQG